jgi:hypothetical protein
MIPPHHFATSFRHIISPHHFRMVDHRRPTTVEAPDF